MYDKSQKGLDPLKDERLNQMEEALKVKETDQIFTQEKLTELEEKIKECQGIIETLEMEKLDLTGTVESRDKVILEMGAKISGQKVKKNELKLQIKGTEPTIVALKRL